MNRRRAVHRLLLFLPGALVAPLAVSWSQTPALPSPLIDDLSDPASLSALGTGWQLVTDQVMGGVSRGTLTRETVAGRPALVMRGDVRLENDGGFIQMALDLARPEAPGGRHARCSPLAGARDRCLRRAAGLQPAPAHHRPRPAVAVIPAGVCGAARMAEPAAALRGFRAPSHRDAARSVASAPAGNSGHRTRLHGRPRFGWGSLLRLSAAASDWGRLPVRGPFLRLAQSAVRQRNAGAVALTSVPSTRSTAALRALQGQACDSKTCTGTSNVGVKTELAKSKLQR